MTRSDEAAIDSRRVPVLEGGRNFRDMGGYAAADGRRVRWGMLYRTGSMAELTETGVRQLAALGLHGICDLRTNRERAAEPYDWVEPLGVSGWTRDHETSFGDLYALLASGTATAESARAVMLEGYRRLPFEQGPAYAELFRRIAAGHVPLAFGCSAGKDRAGTGAALLLTALGVARADVVADYVLTARTVDLRAVMAAPARRRSLIAVQPQPVLDAILDADPRYLTAMLDRVAPSEEAFAAYLRDTLGVDGETVTAMRERLLEP